MEAVAGRECIVNFILIAGIEEGLYSNAENLLVVK